MTKRAWLGLAFILGCATTIVVAVSGAPGADTLAARLWDHTSGRMVTVEASFTEKPDLRPGDPVYTVEDHAFALAGRVAGVVDGSPFRVRLRIDPAVPRRLGAATVAALSPWAISTATAISGASLGA